MSWLASSLISGGPPSSCLGCSYLFWEGCWNSSWCLHGLLSSGFWTCFCWNSSCLLHSRFYYDKSNSAAAFISSCTAPILFLVTRLMNGFDCLLLRWECSLSSLLSEESNSSVFLANDFIKSLLRIFLNEVIWGDSSCLVALNPITAFSFEKL